MCSSTGMSASGLNFGNDFLGYVGNGCKGVGIVTARGLLHGFCAIVKLLIDDNADEVPDGLEANIEILES